MNSVIFNPIEEFESQYRALHAENTKKYLDNLVEQSGVNIEQNRETVKLYNEFKLNLEKFKKKYNLFRFLRVLMCLTIILIPLVIIKITPIIQDLRSKINEADKRAAELLEEAKQQMLPLNRLFSDRDCLKIIENTIPLFSFDESFSVKKEEDMRINYDFVEFNSNEQSTLDVLAGSYNENPFLFENKLIHTMGTETYHGSLVIRWTETYRDSDGNYRTRTRSETLHASVTKPKPYYSNQVVLNYCTQAGPELEFSRDASHLDQLTDKEIEKLVKKSEKVLKKMDNKALSENRDFTSMTNTKFETLFNALNRTNELQFRSLFTPLAQTNMVSLIRSKIGFGDDFYFFKNKRTNRIVTEHSQNRVMKLYPNNYISYSYDLIESSFLVSNVAFFKEVYFDFAPLFAIPSYQDRPVHSLKPIPDYNQLHSLKECEALANTVEYKYVVHPDTKTQAILKTSYVGSKDNVDETCITAYSYDMIKRIDLVPVYGGDGYYHDVPVEWYEYIPLEAVNNFYVATDEIAENKTVISRRNGLSIFQI